MTTTASSHLYSVEEAKLLEDAEAYELIDGVLKMRQMGAESSEIEAWIIAVLVRFARPGRSHVVLGPSAALHIFPERPRYFRRPDVSVIARSRLEDGVAPRGDLYLAPDLAVEVLSPNDKAYEMDEKLGDYLRAGVRMVWIVYPESRTLMLYRPAEPALRLSADEEIPGFDVLPGFQAHVRDLFPE